MNHNATLPSKNNSDISNNLKFLLAKECRGLTGTIVIENVFKETNRDGKATLGFVRLALTSRTFVIDSDQEHIPSPNIDSQLYEVPHKLITLYPWRSVKLSVFKKSNRNCIKVIFCDNSTRYFELLDSTKVKIYWGLWRQYVEELQEQKKKWPFTDKPSDVNEKPIETDCLQIYVPKPKTKRYPPAKWTDKFLYLGSIREVEDQIRPRPVPGLGKTEEIKLLYLKPRYFGCWEQSEHWVQCGESMPEFTNQHK